MNVLFISQTLSCVIVVVIIEGFWCERHSGFSNPDMVMCISRANKHSIFLVVKANLSMLELFVIEGARVIFIKQVTPSHFSRHRPYGVWIEGAVGVGCSRAEGRL